MSADNPLPANHERPPDAEANAAVPAPLFHSEDLFAGQKMVLIQHAGEQYRLLITRNDRLILQK